MPEHPGVILSHSFLGGYAGPAKVSIVGRKLKGIPKALARWMKRRAAIEPTIGHLRNDGRLGRNFLGGVEN